MHCLLPVAGDLAPLGIAIAKDPVGPGYKVFVCQSPDILVFEDKDGDGHADGPPKKLLTGFGGIDHDHGVHGIRIGPDMKLYFSVGDPGGLCVHNLQSSDGKGRKWTTNDTDCRAGTIWRCDLDGTNLELIADGFRNEYEPCVDSFGTVFVSDNDDDGQQQTRICYVMPGGDYGYQLPHKVSHWNEEVPGIVPKVLRTYFGAPTGMCFYEGTLFPKKYWGQPLHTDAGPRQVRCYHLTPDGALRRGPRGHGDKHRHLVPPFGHLHWAGRQRVHRGLVRSRRRRPRHRRLHARPHLPAGAEGEQPERAQVRSDERPGFARRAGFAQHGDGVHGEAKIMNNINDPQLLMEAAGLYLTTRKGRKSSSRRTFWKRGALAGL